MENFEPFDEWKNEAGTFPKKSSLYKLWIALGRSVFQLARTIEKDQKGVRIIFLDPGIRNRSAHAQPDWEHPIQPKQG